VRERVREVEGEEGAGGVREIDSLWVREIDSLWVREIDSLWVREIDSLWVREIDSLWVQASTESAAHPHAGTTA
jgi:hypothetical protein